MTLTHTGSGVLSMVTSRDEHELTSCVVSLPAFISSDVAPKPYEK